MNNLWQGVAEDFSDVPHLGQGLRVLLRMVMAAALGGVLGWERSRAHKSAGLRTHMLVALGAALFALVPQLDGMSLTDMSRVVQGIVTGIGFIGAGAILKQSDEQQVKGLTTAAGIWLTAGIGMAAGMGRQVTAILATLLSLAILTYFQSVEDKLAGEAAAKSHRP